jgi:hypothetical protein
MTFLVSIKTKMEVNKNDVFGAAQLVGRACQGATVKLVNFTSATSVRLLR